MENNYLYGIDYKFDGDWDRIAAKYDKNYKPKFIDYLGHASQQDIRDYENSFNRNMHVERMKVVLAPYYHKIRHIAKVILEGLNLYKPKG